MNRLFVFHHGCAAVVQSMLDLLLIALCVSAFTTEANPLCDSCTKYVDADVLPASQLVLPMSLLQRAHVTNRSAPSAIMLLAESQPTGQPGDSPLTRFVDAYPMWVVALSVIAVLGCFVFAVMLLGRVLDEYEASRWSKGQVGRPWYTDDGMQIKVGGGAVLIWTGIGMCVFTQLVYFHTPEGVNRTLDMVEALYLCVQILTTVGYGDLTPAYPAGQVLVSSFILIGVVLVGVVFTETLKVFIQRAEKGVARAVLADKKWGTGYWAREVVQAEVEEVGQLSHTSRRASRDQIEKDLEQSDAESRSRAMIEFVLSMGPFVLSLVLGAVFFRFYPGEDKNTWQAFYMACVTMTSVGFGAVTPHTDGGKLFASLWMLVGVAATAHMILCFGDWFLRRHREIQVSQLQVELLAEMDTDGNEQVDKCEFLCFELCRTGLCEKEDIDAILKRFAKLDIDKSGTIDVEDLRKIGHRTSSSQSLQGRNRPPSEDDVAGTATPSR